MALLAGEQVYYVIKESRIKDDKKTNWFANAEDY